MSLIFNANESNPPIDRLRRESYYVVRASVEHMPSLSGQSVPSSICRETAAADRLYGGPSWPIHWEPPWRCLAATVEVVGSRRFAANARGLDAQTSGTHGLSAPDLPQAWSRGECARQLPELVAFSA